MPVNQAHRPYLEFMRMLARDDEGREVLVELTYGETEWYFAYLDDKFGTDEGRTRKTVAQESADRDRYLELHDRHERLRLEIVMAEVEARHHPVRN